MEMITVVDKNDKVIGEASRDEIYTKMLCHRIVHVLIFDHTGRMALQLRAKHLKYCPDHWSTAVGGHVNSGETYEQAALREFQEELGVNNPIQFLFKNYYEIVTSPSIYISVYSTILESGFNINPKEVQKIEYFTLEQIQKMIDDHEKFHPQLLYILHKYYNININ